MAADSYKNSAAFKLDASMTICADPLMKPIDHSLFMAYSHYMKWPKRTAYLANIRARVMTGNAAQATISASRARLVKNGYLVKVMDKLNGSTLFELNNPRKQIVAEHLQIAEEKLKEWDAERQAKDRLKAKTKAAKASNIVILEMGEGNNSSADRVTIIGDNSLDGTLEHRAMKESILQKDNINNAYARMKAGE